MVDHELRPVLQLAASLRCEWKNIEKSEAESEQATADLRKLLEREVGNNFTSEDANLVVFGSLGRREWIDYQSDLDWTYLVDGQCKSGHFAIAREIKDALPKEFRLSAQNKPERRFAEPGPTGTFGNLGFSHQLIHHIGGQDDTNKNTTQRILLLLESAPIGAKSAYERVIRSIIKRYLEEEPYLVSRQQTRFKVPRFLLNDVVRFWRTMAVDFAGKQHDRRGEGWGLRNAKLRMSRKLIFASGLLTVFGCHLDEKLQAKISTDSRDITQSQNLNLAHIENHILQYVSRTPLDIVALGVHEYGITSEIARKFFSAYDCFLGLVADPEKRERLQKLRAEQSRGDEVFSEVREFSEKFEQALHEIFFKNELLRPLTEKYGVF